jgi:purine-binding chemotaxis protein CheW
LDESKQLVRFSIGGRSLALPLSEVEEVVRTVEVTPLPEKADEILGVIDVRGEVIPVVDIRKQLRIARKPMGLHDHFILVRTRKRTVALLVEGVQGVIEDCMEEAVPSGDITDGIQRFRGVVKGDDGLIPVLGDLEAVIADGKPRSTEGGSRRNRG